MKILIIAAHPDDEVLGMGATIKKLSNKNEVFLCVITEGASAQYANKKMIKIRREDCIKSSKILGISKITFFDFQDMRLDTIPQLEINKKLEGLLKKIRPEIIYTTPNNDLNTDHQKVHESTLVVTRPVSSSVKQVLAYEIPGIIKTPFVPTVYEDVSKEFLYKIKAFKMYKSEIEKFPHNRSIEALESLASLRGMESGFIKAEAFHLIRKIS